MNYRTIGPVLAILAILVSPAFAVIEVKLPLAKMVATDSKAVFAGTITKVTAEDQLVEVTLAATYKGDASAVARIINVPAELTDQLKVKGSVREVAIFAGARSASFHIADRWYVGRPGAKPDIFIFEARKPELDGTFPGTTANLMKALEEIKAGKSTLVDVFPPISLPKPQKIGDLPAGARHFTVSEAQDKTIVLKVNNSMFVYDGKSDVPSKDHITAANMEEPQILASTRASATSDDKPDSEIVLFKDKLFRLPIDNPSHADDDYRLTGSKITSFYPAHKDGFTKASIASIDLNNDNRPDLIILTPEGTLTLLNRGFGCYLVNKTIAAPLLEPVTPIPPSTTAPAVQLPLLAATAHTLYRLNPDGGLYRYDFSQKP